MIDEALKEFLHCPSAGARVEGHEHPEIARRKHRRQAVKPERVAAVAVDALAIQVQFHEPVQHAVDHR